MAPSFFLMRYRSPRALPGRRAIGRFRGALAVLTLAVGLGGCAPLMEGEFWSQANPFDSARTATEEGLAAMAKGDFVAAERRLADALKRDPQDAYAMLWLAVLYQNTDRGDAARALYRRLAAMDPDGQVVITDFTSERPRSLKDVADLNLLRLERGAMAIPPQPMATAPSSAPRLMPAADGLGGGEQAVLQRFDTLRRLQSDGLVTAEEFAVRRAANLGALLPMTAPAPAIGLDQPPPGASQLGQRLEAINRSLQLGAITPEAHMAERAQIIDALLPAVPMSRATPPPAPQGLMEAAKRIGRLERLAAAKLITPEELKRERDAIETAIMQPPSAGAANAVGRPVRRVATAPASRPVQRSDTAAAPAPRQSAARAAATGGDRVVHLASFRSEDLARRGWQELSGRFGAELSGLAPEYSRVTVKDKGTFWRVKAGPLSLGDAENLCRRLKARQQYCDILRAGE